MNELYQIGLPVESLSTVHMLWVSYKRPCKYLIGPAKTDDWAIVEMHHEVLAAAIIEYVPSARVHIKKESISPIHL